MDGEMMQQLLTSVKVLSDDQKVLSDNQKKVLELLCKREECFISSVNSTVWKQILNHYQLRLQATELLMAMPTITIPEFVWEDTAESAQSDRYMAHLRQYISVRGRNLDWIRGDSDKNLLSVVPASNVLPLQLKGTCDAALVWREYVRNNICSSGLAVVFELKKKVEGAQFQAMAELLAASVLSQNFQPVVVLTDLIDSWRIYFCDGDAICCMSLDGKRNVAVGLIEELVANFEGPDVGTTLPPRGPSEGVLDAVFKRRKFAASGPRGGQSGPAEDVASLDDLEPFLSAKEYQHAILAQTMAQFLQLPVVQQSLMRQQEDDRRGERYERDTTPPCWGVMYS